MPQKSAIDHAGQMSFEQLVGMNAEQIVEFINANADALAQQLKDRRGAVSQLVAKLPAFEQLDNLAAQPVGKIARVLRSEAKALARDLAQLGVVSDETATKVGDQADRIVAAFSNGHLAAMTVGGLLLLVLIVVVLVKVVF